MRFIYFFISVLWIESTLKVYCFGSLFDRGFIYMLLFSIPLSLVCTLLSSIWNENGNRRAAAILIGSLTGWHIAQSVYHTVFKTFLVLDTLTMASDAIGNYWREALTGVINTLPAIAFLLIPAAVLYVVGWWLPKSRPSFKSTAYKIKNDVAGMFERLNTKANASILAAAIIMQIVSTMVVLTSTNGLMSPSVIYTGALDPNMSVSRFGLMTTLRLDLRQLLFGEPRVIAEATTGISDKGAPGPSAALDALTATGSAIKEVRIDNSPNVLDIDFKKLAEEETDEVIKDMHLYFADRKPTLKNQYTGMFKGKNLLFFTAEGFWRYAVNEKYTPTLYKLANEGFVFKDFYNPLWWKSTTDGEYVACTSLIPTGARRSFKASGANSMPFCMGNQLKSRGYPTKAYHNHTYTYYDRDISHPNMGYDYYGLGNGLEVRPTWPESDLEMMELTLPEALKGDKPFHNYYMTVSGHMNYTFVGNYMSGKHKDAVEDLNMSEEAKAYIACNIELDKALEYTLKTLEEAGELENTVICLSGDHYPYAMNPATWDEFLGGPMDMDFEIFHSTLILWSGDMKEPVVIDKPCSSLDILPTLSNLFGLDYDSRLLMGRDILSDSPGIVMLSNKSFITEEGRYSARTDEFMPDEGVEVPEDYALRVFREVQKVFKYAVEILDNNYYSRLGINPAGQK